MTAERAPQATYHEGERYVQTRAGQAHAATAALGGIDNRIPPPAAEFLAEREMLVLAATDGDGRVWVTHLTGAPGFMHVSDERTLRVAAVPNARDPLAAALAGRTRVGTIAIDFATRRRMRLNGISTGNKGGLTIVSEQVFANCPKFISARSVDAIAEDAIPRARHFERLDAQSRARIANADTFFIGTAHEQSGADASHRGGSAGFVAVVDDRTLRFPDYRGNAMYMTLGNVVASPRVGLLFIDWANGDALQLTGTAEIDWDAATAAKFPGAQRMITVTIDRIVATKSASALRWSNAIPSRVNPRIATE